MKRRLEIARGLLHHPAVLFLDEPTVGLDPQTRENIWEHVHELRRREGITVFMTTHYMDEADQCDRIGIIDHARLIALDTPAAFTAGIDRKSTRLNSSHLAISYAVFCFQKKKKNLFSVSLLRKKEMNCKRNGRDELP